MDQASRNQSGRIGVLVVDDEAKLRNSWERVLDAQPDLACAGTLGDAEGLEEKAAELGAAVVLLDLHLPGRDPLEAIRGLAGGDCRVIVCSGDSDPDLLRRVFDAGAWAFVDKLTPPRETLEVIRRVAGGEAVLPRGFGP